MERLNCIVVDDDEIDRLTVVSFAKRFPVLNLLGSFTNAESALDIIDREHIDVLFLDIDMPGLSGMNLRRKAIEIPVCIFITAHPEHAVESFHLDTLDFIVKPVKINRFTETVLRISEFMEIRHKASLFEASLGADTIYIKEGYKKTKVKLHDILYIEALKDYTLLVTLNKRHCVHASIGTLLKEAHFSSFIRIHRSYAVQKNFIQSMGTSDIQLHNNVTIPIGRSYRDNLIALQ
jgi:two-component system LytT family response regulator